MAFSAHWFRSRPDASCIARGKQCSLALSGRCWRALRCHYSINGQLMIQLVLVLCMESEAFGVAQLPIDDSRSKLIFSISFFLSTTTGVIAVGLFADNPVPLDTTNGRMGFFKSGDWYLLGVQSLSALCLTCWGLCSTFILLYMINIIIPIRMDPNEELVGADLMEHRIRHSKIGISRAISALSPLRINLDDVSGVPPIGQNPGEISL